MGHIAVFSVAVERSRSAVHLTHMTHGTYMLYGTVVVEPGGRTFFSGDVFACNN